MKPKVKHNLKVCSDFDFFTKRFWFFFLNQVSNSEEDVLAITFYSLIGLFSRF